VTRNQRRSGGRARAALQGAAATQSFTAGIEAAPVIAASVGRDGYAVTPPPPPPPPPSPPKIARMVPLRNFAPVGNLLYTPNPNGAIQWPFVRYVPIASGFGPRSSPCGGCSSFHEGIDMLAGAGAAIGAIAPGVVSAAGPDTSGSYGTRVLVDHVINGQVVRSLYAHMVAGSTAVTVGQTVAVGQTLGLVGSTGASSGAHLHLGISVGGALVDPYAWLIANAN
jgi:murein DD-endopeptidase MepM/ murein hydrolase activator NlpD